MHTLTRRTLLSLVAAIPLASGWPELAAPEDEGPIWDFEIDGYDWGDGTWFVSALARGSIPDDLTLEERDDQNEWGSWMFRWPKREAVEQMGYRAWCDWMIGDEWEEGRVGTVTVRHAGQTTEVTS